MKLLSRIVWAEGMYLGPHHFQAQNRYFEESVHFATASLWKNAYGFSACQLDSDALRNGTVALVHARGIFEDGLTFDIPGCDSLPESRNITGVFPPTADQLTVFLAVPRWLPDGQNCNLQSGQGVNTRYTGVVEMMHDENTGRDAKPVQLGHKNIRLMLEFEPREDLMTLPIARLMRDGSGHFIFDPAFVPPCLRLSANEHLTSMLHRLVQILEDKSAVVSREQQQSAGKFQAGMSARHVSQFWFLHAINSGLTPLRHLLLSKHGHPEELFCEMSRLAGALCTFGLDVPPRSLPHYDHRNPGPSFDALDDHIRRHLEIVAGSQTILIPLQAVDRYFYEGAIKDQRCFERSRWILGVHAAVGEAELITRVPSLVKMCSAKFVSDLVKRALPGLTLTHLEVPPAAVSARVDSQYFTVNRSGPCWEHIMQTRTVGVYVPGELPAPELELIVILEK
ncbi:MAG: type VI secretion system baseplate subunit TssK [Candidatus Sulfotelmatobacter sp.]